MLQLIKRCPEYTQAYKEYCQELYDHNVVYFRPSNPNNIDDDWFSRTKSWYARKEKGLVDGQPVGFHYWAVDDGKFLVNSNLEQSLPKKSCWISEVLVMQSECQSGEKDMERKYFVRGWSLQRNMEWKRFFLR